MSVQPRTIAWVESPLQLLSAIEATAVGALTLPVRIHARGPRLRYGAMFALYEAWPIDGVELVPDSSPARIATDLADRDAVEELALADLFSGQTAVLLLRRRDLPVVVLDDGSSTLVAMSLLSHHRAPLVRPKDRRHHARRLLGHAVHRSLRRRLPDRLRTVSGLPRPSAAAHIGLKVTEHSFGWSRSLTLPWRLPEVDRVVLGSALASDGLLDPGAYHEWIDRQLNAAPAQAPPSFIAHRREDPSVHQLVRRAGGTVAGAGGLPVELVAGHFSGSPEFVTLPSTTVLTLPLVAPMSRVQCWDIPDHWWLPGAPQAMRALTSAIPEWAEEGRARDRDGVQPVYA